MTTLKLTEYSVPKIDDLPDVPCPYLYQVIVAPLEPRKKTSGGIILPSEFRDMEAIGQQFGVIVSKGPGAFRTRDTQECLYDPEPQIGDVVIFAKYSGAGRILIKEVETTDENGKPVIKKTKMMFVSDKDILMLLEDPTGYCTH